MTVNLAKGKHQSCGCDKIARMRKTKISSRPKCRANDGKTPVSKRPEYRIYRQMLDRCYLETARNYPWYGGRGVGVCERWRRGENGLTGFEAFFEDMGPRAKGLSLDRIDVDSDYGPSNCRWATWAEQARNKRNNRLITARGETKPISDWAAEIGVDQAVIANRIDRGWPVETAVTTPPLKTWNRHVGHNYRRAS